MLWGPPGTGKTLLGTAVAKAHDAEFVQIEPGNLMTAHVGDSEIRLKKIFEKAKNNKTIIFIDELDRHLKCFYFN